MPLIPPGPVGLKFWRPLASDAAEIIIGTGALANDSNPATVAGAGTAASAAVRAVVSWVELSGDQVAVTGTGALAAQSSAVAGTGSITLAAITGTGALAAVPPKRSNFCLQSQAIDAHPPWDLYNVTIGSNAILAPDGTLTADSIVEDTANANHFALQEGIQSSAAATVHTLSMHAKAGTSSWVKLYSSLELTDRWVNFNLTTGAIGQTSHTGLSPVMTALGNGWYRCSFVYTPSFSSVHQAGVFVANGDIGIAAYTGTGSNVYVWGVQLERGSVVNGYLPTTTAAANVEIGLSGSGTVSTSAGVNYSDTISPSSLPVGGQAVAPVYTQRYADTIAAAAVPIGGQTIVPVYTARYSDSITPSSVPVGGATITPVFSAGAVNYTDTITAGALPVVGLAITPVFSAGRINYTDTIAASSVPVVGAAIAPVYTARYSDTISASTVPVGGAALADAYGRGTTLIAGAVPVTGQSITPVYTARYSDAITAAALPIGGRTIVPVFSAGAVNYTDTISRSVILIDGQAIAPVYSVNTTDTIAASALPIGGRALADLFAIRDTIAASTLSITGQTITPVAHLVGSPIKSYGIIAVQTEPGIIIGDRDVDAITGDRTPPANVTGQQNISALIGKRTAPATWDARQ